jgi:hypothetical protein
VLVRGSVCLAVFSWLLPLLHVLWIGNPAGGMGITSLARCQWQQSSNGMCGLQKEGSR